MLEAIFDPFVNQSPLSVMAAATVRRVINPARLDAIFEQARESQYTHKLLFSTAFALLGDVVTGKQRSVHAAYHSRVQEMGVSVTAVYDKLAHLETSTSQRLVREVAKELAAVIRHTGGALPDPVPGYRLKLLDGNCLAASEHRLQVLRSHGGGALPGKNLVVLDPALRLALDVFPCEDGHAQERSLLDQVLPTVRAGDLWVADRNFCVARFLHGIAAAGAHFIIRHHANLPCTPEQTKRCVGQVDGNQVYEQNVTISTGNGQTLALRRIEVHLQKPTRNGDDVVAILTNAPARGPGAITGIQVAQVYRGRWTIETAFQELAGHLNSEIETLGYPKAALFGFAVALVAYNIMATLKAAMRAAHGIQKVEEEVSNYYIADELRGIGPGMMIAIPLVHWDVFIPMDPLAFAGMLVWLAGKADLRRFKKHPRGPKKPCPVRKYDPKRPHVSTARLLNEQKQRKRRNM